MRNRLGANIADAPADGKTYGRKDSGWVDASTSGVALASTAPAALAAVAAVGNGTTAARANHVHAIPGVSAGSVRGTVLIQAAIADLSAAPTMADFNGLLAKLRAAGVLAA